MSEEKHSVCPICTEDMPQPHKLECGHEFHTGCIMKWFRAGSNKCPLCRCSGDSDCNLNFMDVRSRAAWLKIRARRKDAPKELQRLVEKEKMAKEKEKRHRDRLKRFELENKEQIATYRKLRDRSWTLRRRVGEHTRRLGLYSSDKYPIPVVVRATRNRRIF